jgi:hypothetical protein
MATGKKIGEYSAKFTTLTFSPGPHGCTLIQANVEGSATGMGAVLGTATFIVAGGRSGSYSWYGIAYLDNGEQVTSNGTGTYESIGKHRWGTVNPVVQQSDGLTFTFEGEIDLAERSWTGKLFERT